MDYRFKHDITIFRFPKGNEEEDRGDHSCCCVFEVLASITDPDVGINDVSGFYEKKSDAGDVVTFQMTKVDTGNIITNYGTVGNFPNEALGIGFIYDWRQILDNEGVGRYRIDEIYTISGVSGTVFKGCYNLQEYSIERAAGTVRLLSYFNSYFLKEDFDFTGSNFKDSIRFPGFFGERKPNTEIKQLLDSGRYSRKTTRENPNGYEVQSDPVLNCITSRLIDFFYLNEDETYVTDHNAHNHVYYAELPIVPNGTAEVDYKKFTRLASVKLPYGDRKMLDKSMYNGI